MLFLTVLNTLTQHLLKTLVITKALFIFSQPLSVKAVWFGGVAKLNGVVLISCSVD